MEFVIYCVRFQKSTAMKKCITLSCFCFLVFFTGIFIMTVRGASAPHPPNGAPTIQASGIVFSNVLGNSFTITWTNGNGEKRAVFVKEGSGAITNPVNSTTYTASASWFVKGSQLGSSGYYCVYNGTGNTVSVIDLKGNTQYTVQAFEYNGSPGSELYQTSTATGNPNTKTTEICNAGETWTSQGGLANSCNSVAYGVVGGTGLFVAVASQAAPGGTQVMTSPDGLNWTPRNAANTNQWYSVAYGTPNGNPMFVAVAMQGNSDRVMTSPDGINWTARTVSESYWRGVTFGNGMFVAVAICGPGGTSYPVVMTSTDGITWTNRSAGNVGWAGVTYGNGKFVAVGDGSWYSTMTSPDGITWTIHFTPSYNAAWYSVTYGTPGGNPLFVAVSPSGNSAWKVMSSPDGVTWTNRTPPVSGNWRSVTYGNGLYAATATWINQNIMTSPDGINWTTKTPDPPFYYGWEGITYGNGSFVGVGYQQSVISSCGPLLVVTTNTTHVNCFGNSNGSITTSVSNGVPPFIYSWSNGATTSSISGLSSGTYTVTLTDATPLTVTASATVTQPAAALAANASVVTHVDCYGNSNGSVTVSVSGGTTPYAYSWSSTPVQTNQTATGLTAGTYTVTVTDAHSCTTTSSATVTQPAATLSTIAYVVTYIDCYGNSN